ncbi:hypothetical protein TrRE_jg5067 [Triparma retinervis]|uniref:UDENN domain-containing protein n=1 Tax=Triparma retinervis TaxID=2557542 RepID=A0A9W6ZYJ3_9STRA|nr:hypothetical protein TrRE_jg5067 [Triparma retinervis]
MSSEVEQPPLAPDDTTPQTAHTPSRKKAVMFTPNPVKHFTPMADRGEEEENDRRSSWNKFYAYHKTPQHDHHRTPKRNSTAARMSSKRLSTQSSRYSLNGSSRFSLPGRLSLGAAASPSSSPPCSPAINLKLDAFLQKVTSASLNPPAGQENEDLRSFTAFHLLGLNPEFGPECLPTRARPKTYLDPVLLNPTAAIACEDSFTGPTTTATTTSDEMTAESLAPFCFPTQLSTLILPRSTLQSASKLNFKNFFKPKLQLLQFTNAAGVTLTGVSIRVPSNKTATLSNSQKNLLLQARREQWAYKTLKPTVLRWTSKMRLQAAKRASPFFSPSQLNATGPLASAFKGTPGVNGTGGFMSNLKARMTSSKKPRPPPASASKTGAGGGLTKVNLFAAAATSSTTAQFATPMKTPKKTKSQLRALSQSFASAMKEKRKEPSAEARKAGKRAYQATLEEVKILRPGEEESSSAAKSLFGSPKAINTPLEAAPKPHQLLPPRTKRHKLLTIIQASSIIPAHHVSIHAPRNQYAHAHKERKIFELQLPLRNAAPIRLPLPLPRVGGEWGLAKLLVKIGGDNLMRIIHLMMLERNVLILGGVVEEVTSCACALVQLLSPFKWAGTFIPLLPNDMTDFLLSPVPFIVGMVKGSDDICGTPTVKEANESGLSIIDLDTGLVTATREKGIEAMLPLASDIVVVLGALHCRLATFAEDERNSGLGTLDNFVGKGCSNLESLTIASVRSTVGKHLKGMGGEIASGRNRWQKYGMLNRTSGDFEFYPGWFLEPFRAELEFKQSMVHTQLFVSFVDKKRKEDIAVDAERTGRMGSYIAHWLWFRWWGRSRGRGRKKGAGGGST